MTQEERTVVHPDLHLLRLTDLRGTAYFEFRPGLYVGAHWSPESVYLTEEAFNLVLPMLERHHAGVQYYGETVLGGGVCRALAADLLALVADLQKAFTPIQVRRLLSPADVPDLLFDEPAAFEWQRAALAATCVQLAGWLTASAERRGQVTVFGL